jgi:hypothetical protein
VNECLNSTLNTCNESAICTNTNGSYTCACKSGFSGNGRSCEDLHECDLNTHGCHSNASCHNTHGSHICTCVKGFSGDGYNCTDINECLIPGYKYCDSGANCTNTFGSWRCKCKTGYIETHNHTNYMG